MSRIVESSSPPGEQTQPVQPVEQQQTPLGSLLAELRGRKRGQGVVSMMGANFESAIDALWMNRARSFLTTLGIFIGIAAVIAAITLTQGATAQVNNQIGSLGNTVTVMPGSTNE